MLADMAFRIVSHIVNLTPMCDTLAIEVGFGTALAKRVSHVRKPVRMPSQRRSEQVVNEQIAPTKWRVFLPRLERLAQHLRSNPLLSSEAVATGAHELVSFSGTSSS